MEEMNFTYATVAALLSWAIAIIYLCFICCCWSNIALGASIMECASVFVSQNLRVVMLPVLMYVCTAAFFVYWLVSAIFIYSIGTPIYRPGYPVAIIVWEDEVWGMMWIFSFGLFWIIAFIICL
jgi:hypothetical protein